MSETNDKRPAPSGGAAAPARPRTAKSGASKAKPGTAARRAAASAKRAGSPGSKAKRGQGSGFELSALAASARGALGGLFNRRGAADAGSRAKKGGRESLLKSKFYRIYFALLTLAIIGIAVGTVWLNGLLKDYESAQPVYVAQEVAKIFE